MNTHNHLRPRLRFGAVATVSILLVVAAATPASAHGSRSGRPSSSPAQVLLDGLNSPKGLDSFLGQPIVSQGAAGAPAPVVARIALPWQRPETRDLSDPMSLVDVAAAADGSLWGLGADHLLYRKAGSSRTFVPVADIAAYQQHDPDPFNAADDPTESNPYGLAVMANGDALVADAANNDLLRVDRTGHVATVARFDVEMVATDHLGDPALPPALPAESVPTSIAVVGHWIYVGELKGFPFRPGSSRIWRIDARAHDAVCSTDPAHATRTCRSAMSGFTAIQDLDIDPWTGRTYVYQLAEDGVLAFEAGFGTGEFPPAVLERIDRNGRRTELAAGQLSQPGGVDVSLFGTLHVTDGMFGNGRLVRIKG